jgi:BirA family biotin operon repressor/biotin-[acetyl-CoA-carboxylase] ligase
VSLPAVSRLERFERIGSTQAVVREWLAAGTPEVCLAVADEQTAGRGRLDRRWQAGPGQGLLVSAGFRPSGLTPERAWRLPAVAALAMLDAARALLGADVELALKWPNDLVSVRVAGLRKLGGVLAESVLGDGGVARAVVGLGVNVDWPAADFPPEMAAAMGSLREEAGRSVDREALLGAWIERLLAAYGELRDGRFDAASWSAAQVVIGARLVVDVGGERLGGVGHDVDPESGALLLRTADGEVREVAAGDVVHCRVDRFRGSL